MNYTSQKAHFATYTNGAQGITYTLSLNNDFDILVFDQQNNLISSLPIEVKTTRQLNGDTTNSTGSFDLSITPGSTWIENTHYTFNKSSGVLTIKKVPTNFTEAAFLIQWNISDSSTLTKTFTLKKQVSNVDYEIETNKNVINSTNLGGVVNIKVKKKDINGVKYLTANDLKTDSLTLTSSQTLIWNSGGYWTLNYSKGQTGAVTITLKQDTLVWDIETIEFVSDGQDGKTPEVEIIDGYWYINGKQSIEASGKDGKTPEIKVGDNGNWFIDGMDSGQKARGEAGKDGNCIEYVYYRSETEQKNLSAPSYTGTTLTTGWTPSPQGITETYKYEYMSVRIKAAGATNWSDFSPPVIWSKWGDKGQDGDGIEYKYCLTNSEEKPVYPAPSDASYVWTDEPSGVSAEKRYEYVVSIVVSPIESTAKKINTADRNFSQEVWEDYGKKGHEENWTIRDAENLDNSHIYLGDYAYVDGFVENTSTPARIYGKVIELYNSSTQDGHIKMRSTHLVIGDYKTPTSTVSLWSNYSQPGREEIKRDRYYCITNENKAPLLYENFNDATLWWKHPSSSVQFSENGLQIFVDDTIKDVTVFAMKAEQWPESRLVSFEGWITSGDDDDGADVDEFYLNCDLVPRNHEAPEDGYPQFTPRLTKERRRYSYLMEFGPEANVNNNKEVSLRLFSDISHTDSGDRVPNDIYIENLIIQPLSNNPTWTKNTYASLEKGQYLWNFDIIEYSKEDAFGNKYSVTPIEQQAYLAIDGTSPYLISFDNDSATIGATKDGSVDKTTLENVSKVTTTVYFGKDEITDKCTFEWVASGGELVDLGKQSYFTKMNNDTATATVTVKLNGVKIGTKIFTISKSRTGQTGDAAVTYKLSVSPNSVNLTTNPGGVAPSFIVTKYSGSTITDITNSTTLYTITRNDDKNQNEKITGKTIFTLKVNGVDVDTETVEVVENGSPGPQGPQGPQGGKGDTGDTGILGTKTESIRIYYPKGDTGKPDKPSDGNDIGSWGVTEPDTNNTTHKYIWSCTGVKTTTYKDAAGTIDKVIYSSWTTPELYKAYLSDAVQGEKAATFYKLFGMDAENGKEGIEYDEKGNAYINASLIQTGALVVRSDGVNSGTGNVIFSAGVDDSNKGVVNIAGWTVDSNSLYKQITSGNWTYKTSVSAPSSLTEDAFSVVRTSASGTSITAFSVNGQGNMVCTSGEIAKWNIYDGTLYSGSGNNKVTLYSRNLYSNENAITIGNSGALKTWRIVAGNKFGVTKDGSLYASAANIEGTLRTGSTDTFTRIQDGEVQNASMSWDSMSSTGVGYSIAKFTSGKLQISRTNTAITSAGDGTATATLGWYLNGENYTNGIYTCPFMIYAPDLILGDTSGEGQLWGTWKLRSGAAVASWRGAKYDIEDLPDKYSVMFDNLHPVRHKYIDGTSGRYHTGFILDELKTAMDIAGVGTDELGAYCVDNEETGSGGIRYSELVALNVYEIQKLKPRISALEQTILDYEFRISKLETEIQNLKS